MTRVFICSPCAGDIEANVKRAREMCLHAVRLGHAPFAPHLLYPQFLNDRNELDRAAGIAAGLAFLSSCDEVWVPKGVEPSPGMAYELKRARWAKIPIV